MNVGFVGLGNMGAPMAPNLLQAGHRVTVYNARAARRRVWSVRVRAGRRPRRRCLQRRCPDQDAEC
ncbi:MAG: NAD(P)-binding domain-containing protein [Xanthobacteraceae bacterium]